MRAINKDYQPRALNQVLVPLPTFLLTVMLTVILAAIYSLPSHADTYKPLPSQNRSPLKQPFAPQPVQFFQPETTQRLDIKYGVFNSSQQSNTGSGQNFEQLILDGELQRVALNFAQRISEGGLVSIAIPWIYHSGGGTDSAIETWHEWFGLPNGNRDLRAQNLIEYRYIRGDQTLVQLDDQASGVGDVRLSYQYQSERDHSAPSALHHFLRIDLSIRSGSESKLTGSGATSVSFHMGGYQNSSAVERLGWFGSAGISLFENTGLLADYRKRHLWDLQLGTAWRYSDRLSLKLQLESQSALFKSNLSNMSGSSTQLSAGFETAFGDGWSLAVFFTEDIDVGTAPDFGLGAKLGVAL